MIKHQSFCTRTWSRQIWVQSAVKKAGKQTGRVKAVWNLGADNLAQGHTTATPTVGQQGGPGSALQIPTAEHKARWRSEFWWWGLSILRFKEKNIYLVKTVLLEVKRGLLKALLDLELNACLLRTSRFICSELHSDGVVLCALKAYDLKRPQKLVRCKKKKRQNNATALIRLSLLFVAYKSLALNLI